MDLIAGNALFAVTRATTELIRLLIKNHERKKNINNAEREIQKIIETSVDNAKIVERFFEFNAARSPGERIKISAEISNTIDQLKQIRPTLTANAERHCLVSEAILQIDYLKMIFNQYTSNNSSRFHTLGVDDRVADIASELDQILRKWISLEKI